MNVIKVKEIYIFKALRNFTYMINKLIYERVNENLVQLNFEKHS